MNEDIKKVALRLRELREIAGCSTAEMAETFHISHETYLEYESGESDMPISFLSEAAAFFKIQVYELLSGNNPKLHVCQHVTKGNGLRIERSKQYDYQHLAYNFAGNQVLPLLVRVDPAAEGDKLHTNSHPGQEFDYCLHGKIKIVINGKAYVLEEGDSIYYDSSYPHGMVSLSDTPSEILAIVI
ncbi:MAG: XRE family transcriptional regulator [Clostridia bacterium]|nr:XRE family transcriptional regulator [Clostridia bacterium]